MPEGYGNVALYENNAIHEAVEAFNRFVETSQGLPSQKITDSRKQLTKVYYRDCFAGVEYMFMPSNASKFLIRVFMLLPGYSGSDQEAYEVDIFRSMRETRVSPAVKVR